MNTGVDTFDNVHRLQIMYTFRNLVKCCSLVDGHAESHEIVSLGSVDGPVFSSLQNKLAFRKNTLP